MVFRTNYVDDSTRTEHHPTMVRSDAVTLETFLDNMLNHPGAWLDVPVAQ